MCVHKLNNSGRKNLRKKGKLQWKVVRSNSTWVSSWGTFFSFFLACGPPFYSVWMFRKSEDALFLPGLSHRRSFRLRTLLMPSISCKKKGSEVIIYFLIMYIYFSLVVGGYVVMTTCLCLGREAHPCQHIQYSLCRKIHRLATRKDCVARSILSSHFNLFF